MMIFNTRSGRLFFFSTEPQACSYLPDREAVMLFADPNKVVDSDTYGRLIDYGFRRSGDNVYRPHCRACTACIPVRIPVKRFRSNRAQRRARRANQDLAVTRVKAQFTPEHKALYHRYQRRRHDEATSESEAADQLAFLRSRFINTYMLEARRDGELLSVCVVDQLPQGLSAVYTFYDPDLPKRSLGVFGVLSLIDECLRLDLEWLYLGYWIEQCDKMRYKDSFRPLEAYINGTWEPLEPLHRPPGRHDRPGTADCTEPGNPNAGRAL